MKCIVPGKLLIVLAIILALIITACSALASEPYVCDVEAVESIQIARLLDFNENNHYRFKVDVICEISDVSAFAEQLNVIPQSTNWGEPYTMDIGDTIIVVNYPNGDADLLCADAQVLCAESRIRPGIWFSNGSSLMNWWKNACQTLDKVLLTSCLMLCEIKTPLRLEWG